MSIKFPCRHCKKGLTAKDEQAGKKVVCPACKRPLIIPRPTSVPSITPEDAEVAAAAALKEEPAATAAAATTIDFTCEFCDASLSVPLDLGGKRHPCPECRRILKVPMPAKTDPSNWRKVDRHLPSAAKRPDEPTPEGAWGNLTKTVVSREALEEADAIPEQPELVTARDRIIYWTKIAVAVLCLILLGLFFSNWYFANRERRALEVVIGYASAPETLKQIGPEGVGELNTLAGVYYVRTQVPFNDAPFSGQPGSGEQARLRFEKALSTLKEGRDNGNATERDASLSDLALAMVELGGSKNEARDKLRLEWDAAQKRIEAALREIRSPEAKLDAYQAVSRRLIDRGESVRALALASSAFSNQPGEKAAARAACALDLIEKNNDKTTAIRVCEELLKEYEVTKDRPPLAAEVVALAMVLDKAPPQSGKSLEDDESTHIGTAEGLARKGQLAEARKQAQDAPNPRLKLRSLVALGGVSKESVNDLTAACQTAEAGLPDPARENWILLRLVRLGAHAGVPADRLKAAAEIIVDPALRGRAKLELFRAQLDTMKQSADLTLADSVDPKTLAHELALAALARHNVRYSSGYLSTARTWSEPLASFGTLGALLGTQKNEK